MNKALNVLLVCLRSAQTTSWEANEDKTPVIRCGLIADDSREMNYCGAVLRAVPVS